MSEEEARQEDREMARDLGDLWLHARDTEPESDQGGIVCEVPRQRGPKRSVVLRRSASKVKK